jgi:hypothetical protein
MARPAIETHNNNTATVDRVIRIDHEPTSEAMFWQFRIGEFSLSIHRDARDPPV